MYNRIFLAGKITEELELQRTSNEISFVKFNLVVHNPNSYYKNVPDTIPCIIWRQNAELFFEKIKKTTLVLLEGRLRGQNNYLEVSVTNFQILASETAMYERTSSVDSTKTTAKPKNLEEKKIEKKEPTTKNSDLGIDWGDLKTEKKDD